MEEERYYSLLEIAVMLGISRQTVYAWVKKGKISAFKCSGTIRVKKTDFDKFIEKFTKDGST